MRSQLFCVKKKNYFASCNALCVVFVLLCCSCWRLACFLCFLAGFLLGFLFFSYWAPFFPKHFLAGEGGRLRIPGTLSLKGYIRMVCFGDMYGGCHGVWGCCVVACGL